MCLEKSKNPCKCEFFFVAMNSLSIVTKPTELLGKSYKICNHVLETHRFMDNCRLKVFQSESDLSNPVFHSLFRSC